MSSGLLRTTQHEFPVLDAAGNLQGFVTRDAIFRAVNHSAPATAADAMTRDIPSLPLRAPLSEVLDAMASGQAPAVAVVSEAGTFLGYITRENIGELMVLRRANRRPV
jgi:stage IV sporulation protein FB